MKTINDIQTTALSKIYNKTTQLKKIQQKIKPYIPVELQTHCNIANFEKGELVFAVQNATWAMRFRYIIPELIIRLRKENILSGVSTIKYYVEPEFSKLFVQ